MPFLPPNQQRQSTEGKLPVSITEMKTTRCLLCAIKKMRNKENRVEDNIQENRDRGLPDRDKVSSIGMKCSLQQLDHSTSSTGDHRQHMTLLLHRPGRSR